MKSNEGREGRGNAGWMGIPAGVHQGAHEQGLDGVSANDALKVQGAHAHGAMSEGLTWLCAPFRMNSMIHRGSIDLNLARYDTCNCARCVPQSIFYVPHLFLSTRSRYIIPRISIKKTEQSSSLDARGLSGAKLSSLDGESLT